MILEPSRSSSLRLLITCFGTQPNQRLRYATYWDPLEMMCNDFTKAVPILHWSVKQKSSWHSTGPGSRFYQRYPVSLGSLTPFPRKLWSGPTSKCRTVASLGLLPEGRRTKSFPIFAKAKPIARWGGKASGLNRKSGIRFLDFLVLPYPQEKKGETDYVCSSYNSPN